MAYIDFQNRWLGKKVDADGVFGFQCVDLVRQYMHEEFGLQRGGAWGDAKDYWLNPVPQVLSKFDKVATQTPARGDIVIFGPTSTNPYGHIGIATGNNNATAAETLEQNGSTGNGSGVGPDAIRTRYINKSRILGVLRPKGVEKMIIPDDDNWYARMRNLMIDIRNRDMTREEFRKNFVGVEAFRMVEAIQDSPEAVRAREDGFLGKRAREENWQGRIVELQTALQNEQNKPPQVVIKEVEKIVGGISAEDSAAIKETNSIVKAIRDLLSRVFK